MSFLNNILKSYYRNRGYETVFRKYKIEKGDFAQSVVVPRATYSPWLDDEAFKEVMEQIKNHTLLDIYRLYEIWQLSKEASVHEGDFLEVGVWRGGSGALIGKIANEFSPDANIYLCDTYEGVVMAGEEDNKYKGGEHADTSKETVEDLATNMNLKNVNVLKGIFPDDTGSPLEGNKFCFCHIDVDVYQGTKVITEWIWDRLVVGGVIVIDDHGSSGTQGVTRFVESQRGMKDRMVIHNLNGHGILVKTS